VLGRIASTAVFTLIMPGLAFVFLPALVFGWTGGARDLGGIQLLGLVPIALGLAGLLLCFAGFIVQGEGTPAPYDAPRRLVSGRLYRWTRNPMYVSVTTIVLGEALLFGSLALLGYAAALWVTFHLFVTRYEEPGLRARFGAPYEAYLASVPRWLPRRVVPPY
jgi:protein-S-isoprenylcysteine O-methyltransferase Ste14